MRLAGVPDVLRFQGVASRQYHGKSFSPALGALPENEVNRLTGQTFSQALSSSAWNRMREVAAEGYPALPEASAGTQIPWLFPPISGSYAGYDAMLNAALTQTATPGAGASGGGGGPRSNLKGLAGFYDGKVAVKFPRQIRQPFITSNLMWYSGPVLNKGNPQYSNDGHEFLRSALVDSNWDDFEVWLGWAFANGMTPDILKGIDFGRMKWANGKKYPFSEYDIYSFFDRFLKYATGNVDKACIRTMKDNYLRAVKNMPGNMYSLRMSDCPLTIDFWTEALPRLVAVVAVPYAIATLATVAAGAAATGAGAGGAAGGTAAGAGAGASAGATAAVIPAGVEIVTVAASAIPTVGATAATVGAGIAAGSVVAASSPPPISAPQTPAAPTPVIETVVTQASALPTAAPLLPTVGAAISAGSIIATTSPPPLSEPVIEEVVTEASRVEPVEPDVTAATGITSIAIDLPTIQSPPEPTLQEESLSDRLRNGLTDALEQMGADYVSQYLEDYLTSLLGRHPTQGEVDDWGQWVDDGANPNTAPGHGIPLWVWIGLGVALAVAVFKATKRRRKRGS